ncbi:winged helix-turn-helix domain-containing protein [Citrobacter amalonaticus]|uniref:DNA-binding response regulator n=1 Tax=Citrobacter amalonaticus TaxID=35703 RepID=A0AAW9M5V8_CITAM|nr:MULTISPECIES: winged helix-turn-helix domain-containing protein [Citrobacter]MDU1754482.1 winged helix-turn-helix domain-containing protein [Citrobacter sp.]ELR9582244.1 winged helix-turn-helix domain-containing protein [Citrobacter amalonaticus]MBJ9326913.1 winged helix-turn-helix domain-containing protein [Citrobacter amalonaticus]MDV2138323.1 winged helix-turn-helix domain-containing protein [Citrobacter amalonaticus]MEB0585830.1 winged helix-turn-helix domain-containing protein [Citroba
MRVLVMEPDVVHQYYLKSQFEEAGFLVDSATSIKQAELYMLSNYPEIILMNIDSVEGESAIAIKKWRRERRNIKIMVLSSTNDIQYKVNFLNCGADDYVTMPFQIQEVIVRVWVLVRRTFCIPAKKIKKGNVELDLSGKALCIGNNIIRLTGFEFKIMALLMENTGSVLSKSRIMSHIYDDGAVKNNNTVEVLIGRLRKKLAAYNGGKIKNQRDNGYYLKT